MKQKLPTQVLPIKVAARLLGIQAQTIRKSIRTGKLDVPLQFAAGTYAKRYVSLDSLIERYECEEAIEGRLTHSAVIVAHTGREYEIVSDVPEILERRAMPALADLDPPLRDPL